jgi:UPF0716 protein FxsA
MFAGLGLLLIAVPIIELYVLIQVGQVIGVGWTILLLIGISVVGTILLKREGMATWRRLNETIRTGHMPTDEVTDGALVLMGGALLLTPGFVTDVFGLFLLFPLTRSVAKIFARKAFGVTMATRFPGVSAATATGRKVYDARVTDVRRVDGSSSPAPLPSVQLDPSAEDDSPDRTR